MKQITVKPVDKFGIGVLELTVDDYGPIVLTLDEAERLHDYLQFMLEDLHVNLG